MAMKVHFSHAVGFGEKNYPKGTHEIPGAVGKDWYFKHLVKSGSAEILSEKSAKSEPAAPLADASEKRHSGASVKADDAEDEIIDDESGEEEVEDFLEG